MKYTSRLKEAALEHKNCKNCKSIHECKNKMIGYTYLPTIKNNQLMSWQLMTRLYHRLLVFQIEKLK